MTKIAQILESKKPELSILSYRVSVSSQHLVDFQVHEVRRVKRLARRGQSISDALPRGSVEKHLQQSGSVDHYHVRSRSALTALAGGTRVTTGVRCASRYRSSASVGRSAARRTSRRR